MKIAIFFRRAVARRLPRPTRSQSVEMLPDWTVRDWADLPPHHPRRD